MAILNTQRLVLGCRVVLQAEHRRWLDDGLTVRLFGIVAENRKRDVDLEALSRDQL